METIIHYLGKNTFEVIEQNQSLFTWKETLIYETTELEPVSYTIRENEIKLFFQNGSSVTIIVNQHEDLFVLPHTWNFAQTGKWRMHIEIASPRLHASEPFIPCVWYKGNKSGEGCFPSERKADRWSFFETRMSLPGCIQLSSDHWAITSSLNAATDEKTLASVAWGNDSIIYSIPGKEWPFTYQGKMALLPTDPNEKPRCQFTQKSTYTRTVFVRTGNNIDTFSTYENFLRSLEPFLENTQKPTLSWKQYQISKLTHLLSMVRKDAHGWAYLIMGEGNGDLDEVYQFTAGSFLVKGIEAATSFVKTHFVQDSPHLKNQMKRISALFGIPNDENLLTNLAILLGKYYLQGEQDGTYQDCTNLRTGEIGGYLGISEHPEFKLMVNARCAGEAMESYVCLYRDLKKKKIDEPEFLLITKRVAHFFCNCQLSDGSFGRWWTKEGMPENTKGTNGAYIARFFTYLLPFLSPEDPLHGEVQSALIQACSFYANLIEAGDYYGDTLDADSCDKEAGVALLSLFLNAYELFKDVRYLQEAKKAASFLLTWIWQQDSFLPPNSPLGRRNFHTQGMTSVSVAHHHLDFYGMDIAVYFYRLASLSGDTYYEKQAYILCNACRQLIGNEHDGLGRDESFYGWQPEQLNHTYWDYFNRVTMMNGHFDIDIAWVNVLGYDSYLSLVDMGKVDE
jgi:hypothetical protein